MPDVLPRCEGERPLVDDDALVAIGFTSGSTGGPKPNGKTCRSFRASTEQNLAALAGLRRDGAGVQGGATVRPHVNYGTGWAVAWQQSADASHRGRVALVGGHLGVTI